MKADTSEGINVDREYLTNLRFADYVTLFNGGGGDRIHKGNTKYMTNCTDSENILTEQLKMKSEKF